MLLLHLSTQINLQIYSSDRIMQNISYALQLNYIHTYKNIIYSEIQLLDVSPCDILMLKWNIKWPNFILIIKILLGKVLQSLYFPFSIGDNLRSVLYKTCKQSKKHTLIFPVKNDHGSSSSSSLSSITSILIGVVSIRSSLILK